MKNRYITPTCKATTISPARLYAVSVNSTSGANGLGMGDDWTSGSANSRGNDTSWEDD